LPTLSSSTWGNYTLQLHQQGTSLTLVFYTSGSTVTVVPVSAAAEELQQVFNSIPTQPSNTTLGQVQLLLQNATTTAERVAIIESLAPTNPTAGTQISLQLGNNVATNVQNRLSDLRMNTIMPAAGPAAPGTLPVGLFGVASGDVVQDRSIWIRTNANRTNQGQKDGIAGYTADGTTLTVGADTNAFGPVLGAAFSLGSGQANGKQTSANKTDVTSYLGTFYGSQAWGDAGYLSAQTSLGRSRYQTSRQVVGFGTATEGDFFATQLQGSLESGYDFTFGGTTVTPLAGLSYNQLWLPSYTEQGPAALQIEKNNAQVWDGSVGVGISHNIALAMGNQLQPRLRTRYRHAWGDLELGTVSSFAQTPGSYFNSQGLKADADSVLTEAGLTILGASGASLDLDYGYEARATMQSHQGTLKLRMPF
jgi:outer membrane autotransporter protein